MRTLQTGVIALVLVAPPHIYGQSPENTRDILRLVAEFHGNAGVFAVAGYRMGERALQRTG